MLEVKDGQIVIDEEYIEKFAQFSQGTPEEREEIIQFMRDNIENPKVCEIVIRAMRATL